MKTSKLNIKFILKIITRISVISAAFLVSTNSYAAATAIGTGATHSCAALSTGGVKCWGSNSGGELGNGTTIRSNTPVEVQGLSNMQVVAVAGGTAFTCAITSTGTVYCWGRNNYGQLGKSKLALSTSPVQIQVPTAAAKSLSVGNYHACILDIYNNIYCWGSNTLGQLNRNVSLTGSNIMLYAAGMNDISAFQGNGGTTCYTDTSGGAKCFGHNKYGQLGIGTRDLTAVNTYGDPKYVLGLSNNVLSTSSSMNHSCAVKADHTVLCWGSNLFGSLGFAAVGSDAAIFPTPRIVPGLRGDAVAVVTGFMHSCVITSSGGAQCWGQNGVGKLGNGRALPYETASDVIGLNEKIISMSLGSNHTCVLLESGTVKCFGAEGAYGSDTPTYSPIPVTVNL